MLFASHPLPCLVILVSYVPFEATRLLARRPRPYPVQRSTSQEPCALEGTVRRPMMIMMMTILFKLFHLIWEFHGKFDNTSALSKWWPIPMSADLTLHVTRYIIHIYHSAFSFDLYLITLVSSESIIRQLFFLATTLLGYSVPICKSHNIFDAVVFRIHNYSADRFQGSVAFLINVSSSVSLL